MILKLNIQLVITTVMAQEKRYLVNDDPICTLSVDRLKTGPPNVPLMIQEFERYKDETFEGKDTIYWESQATSDIKDEFDGKLQKREYYFARWPTQFLRKTLFDGDDIVSPHTEPV